MMSEDGPVTLKLLRLFVEKITDGAVLSFKLTDAFLMSAGSTRLLARNVGMVERQYYSSMQSLQRNGFVEKANENQFLITPKGLKRVKVETLLASLLKNKFKKKDISGWCLVVFDIPDAKRRERNIFRSILKRLGFIGIQKSVYIAPGTDFNELSLLRDELGISKFVTFLHANVAGTEDDKKLLKKFGPIK